MEKLTKGEVVHRVAEASGEDPKTVKRVIDALSGVIASAVVRGEQVTLNGVGAFSTRATEAREVRNPATGESMTVPAGRALRFRVASALKRAVNA